MASGWIITGIRTPLHFAARSRESLRIFTVVSVLAATGGLLAQDCELYPIALAAQSLTGVESGELVTDLRHGTQPGSFGWLTWAGSPSTPTLVTSLTPPGNSGTYLNPDNSNDHQVSVGDWVQAKPGVSNSQNVRDTLDRLKQLDITVPVWDQARGQGDNAAYRVCAFARIRLVDYRLSGQVTITLRLLRYVACATHNLAPVVNAGGDHTADLPAVLTLNGSVTDDGLPNGSLAINWTSDSAPGTVTFDTPHQAVTTATFNMPGSYVLRLSASDGELSASDAIIVTINQPNRPPIAQDLALVTAEDVPALVTLAGSDPDADALTFFVVEPPTHGTLSDLLAFDAPDGDAPSLVYTPQADYYGPDRFTYKASDGSLESASATILIMITAVNDPPVADPQALLAAEHTPLPVLLSGSDIEGAALTYTVLAQPIHGTLSGIAPDLTYAPEPGFRNTDSFTFKVNDGQLDSAPATVTITVRPLNDAPVANAQMLETDEDTPLSIALAASDPENADLCFIIITPPEHGQLSGAAPNLTYIPDTDFFGPDNFTFKVNDGTLDSLPACVTIGVRPVDDPPQAHPQSVVTDEDTPLNIFLTGSDPEGAQLRFSVVAPPVHGVLSGSPPNLVYMPDPNYHGADRFAFSVNDGELDSQPATVDITINPVNDTPIVNAGPDQALYLPGSSPPLQPASSPSHPSQVKDTKGTNFWLAFPGNVWQYAFPNWYPPRLSLWISAESNATVTVAIARLGFITNLTVAPQSGSSVDIPIDAELFPRGIIENGGIHVTASAEVSVVGLSNSEYVTDSFLCLPTDALGTDYALLSYAGNKFDGGGTEFAIVGTQDSTTAWITLATSATSYSEATPGANGGTPLTRLAGLPYAIVLDAGQTYHLRNADYAPLDFTGTRIVANKPIAVFSGHLCARIPAAFGGCNLLVEQLPPTSSWGRQFITQPLAGRVNGDTFRFLAQANDTQLHINGALVAVLRANEWYETILAEPAEITSSAPILAAQFANASDYDGQMGDPFMMWLPATDQFLASYTVMVPASYWPTNGFPINYLHLIAPSNAVASIQLDGMPLDTSAFAPLAHTGYAGARLPAAHGPHYLAAAVPFGLWVYGFATFDAYGHPAGAILSEAALAAQLNLIPHSQIVAPGTASPILASVTDAAAHPLAGVRVDFRVTGANPTNGLAFTDAAGETVFSYFAAQPGIDFIFASTGSLWASATRTVTDGVTTILTGSAIDDDSLNPALLNFEWTQAAGPAMAPFSSPTSASTWVRFTQPGEYSFRLAASDSLLTGYDDMSVTVLVNQPPLVNAGPDQQVLLRHTLVLPGTMTDDGLPLGSPARLTWSLAAGPGPVSFSDPTSATPSVLFTEPGLYVLRLTADDGQASASDEILVIARAPNEPPSVRAGEPQLVFLPNKARLDASVTDDGQPAGSALTYAWSLVSGPAPVAFSQTNTLDPIVTFNTDGKYLLRLTATDSELSANGNLMVIVSSTYNDRPGVDAGPDQEITFAERALLYGRVTDDGGTSGPVRTWWSKVSGPGTVTFGLNRLDGTQDRLNTAIFSCPGTYVLRLTAYDDLIGASDDVTVVVHPGNLSPPTTANNSPPAVNAGQDTPATLYAPLLLYGVVTDDGLPHGYPVASWWLKLSGPGKAIFADPSAPTTSVSFSAIGTYVLRLLATDFDACGSDDLTVTVTALTNQAPLVNAGPDQVIAAGAASLRGTFTDDGLPANGNVSLSWSKITGSGQVAFASSTALTTSASFSSPGTYVLRLSVTDGALTGTDDVIIMVPTNQPPVVNAGPDVALVLGHPLVLGGTVSDDGQPPDSTCNIAWTKVTGPGTVTFTPPGGPLVSNLAQTTATFSAPGNYVLRLTACDGLDRAWDELNVTVRSPDNLPPVVDAGQDNSITLPATATLNGTANDDGHPAGTLTTEWNLASGPGPVTFTPLGSPGPSQTYVATFAVPGTYVLRLTASDGELTAMDEVTITVYPPAYTHSPPVAELIEPTDSAIVTEPTPVRGTASSQALLSYQLEYRLKPALVAPPSPRPQAPDSWVTFASGTANVTAGLLGIFDPTLLVNGVYELRLLVTDAQGQSTTTPAVDVIVEGNMKLGHLTLSFTDLRLPMAGIPIEVVRTYDSRDKRVTDFGVGWTINLKNIRLQKNRPLGQGWVETTSGGLLPIYSLDPLKPRLITITFPDGRVSKFSFTPAPNSQPLLPIQFPRYAFTPLPGTVGTLAPATIDDPDGAFLIAVGNAPQTDPSAIDLFDLNFFAQFAATATTDELYAYPTLFRFSTPEGYSYLIDEHDGLKSLTDPNGNTITITTNGLFHSAGKSARFERDDLGRITNIIDAAGHSMRYQYDDQGNLAAFIDQENHTNSFTYDSRHNLLQLTDARGISPARIEYDPSGRLLKHIDPSGHEINYTHDLSTRQEMITDRLGHATLLEYDQRGNLIRTTDPAGAVTESRYDPNDNLLSTTDPLGRTTHYTYDALNNLTTVSDPLGNVTRFTYNAQRRVTSAADPRGNTLTYTFDAQGNLLSMRDPLGHETTFRYDTRGLPVAITNPLGHVTCFAYDPSGNLTNEVDALGHTVSYKHDANGNLVSQTTSRTTASGLMTLVTRLEYDQLNRLTNTILPDSTSIRIVRNPIGKPLLTIDQLGRQTTYDYDELGQLVRSVYPDGTSEGSAYDPEGQRVADTNRLGSVTRYSYDPLGHLTRTELPDGATTTNYYDLAGQLIAASDARANTTFYGYDPAGRPIALTNALGQVIRSAYDAAGNLTNIMDALGRNTSFLYDQLNRPIQTLNWATPTPAAATNLPASSGPAPEPLRTSYAYDPLGHRIAQTDPDGKTTWLGYDAVGRLTSVTNPLGHVTYYAYDELGEQISQTDANNHATLFEYNAIGRRIKRTLPGGQAETYAWDAAGNLIGHTDLNGYTTTFSYDAMNRLVLKQPDPRRQEPQVTFAYNALGSRTNMVDAGAVTAYCYDARNRLAEKTVWFRLPAKPQTGQDQLLSARASTLNYSYDPNGNVTSIHSSTPNGAAVTYAYDSLNRLSEVNDPRLGRTAYSYDAAGNLGGYAYPNGVNTTCQYDAFDRLTNLTAVTSFVPLAICAYTLGPAGNRLTAAETVPIGGQQVTFKRVYEYDMLYRLTGEAVSLDSQLSTFTYSYDPVGNRLTRHTALDPTLPSSSHAYDSNDRLTPDTYDANGNTIGAQTPSGALVTDQYDSDNHLTLRTNPDGTTVQIAYDGDGRRVVKTVTTPTNTVTTFYLVDDLNPTGYAQVLEELTLDPADPRLTSPAATRVYCYGHALLAQDQLRDTAWVSSLYGHDGHGSVRYLTDLDGAVTDAYQYDAFGNLIGQTGTTPNERLFAGEQWDSELDLYYLRARYYNPDTGRFWTMDTLEGFPEDPQSLHRYTYCANNPVNRLDPTGQSSLSEVMTVGSIGAATQGLIGSLLRGVMAYSEGLNFKESAQASFDPADLAEDAGTGFIAGLTGWAAGKAAAAMAKPVFQAIERGAPFLLNWTQRWVVRPLTQSEARLQAAWLGWRNRALTNPDAAATTPARYLFDARLRKYRDATTGRFIAAADLPWPANRGFVSCQRGILQPGTIIDRFGKLSGRYAGQPGTAASQRGLPPGSEAMTYNQFEVLKPLPAEIGPASPVPAFGAQGGATQYLFDFPITELVHQGYLRPL
jgi:RHS repeat-associated protein